MAQTKIKAGLFEGIIGNGADRFTLHNTRYNGGTDNYIYLAIA